MSEPGAHYSNSSPHYVPTSSPRPALLTTADSPVEQYEWSSGLVWHRSTACEAGACVEVAAADGAMVLVRESDQVNRTVLMFSSRTWRAFVAEVKPK